VSRFAYNESYPEPDGRSGTHVPIIWYSETQVYCQVLHLSLVRVFFFVVFRPIVHEKAKTKIRV